MPFSGMDLAEGVSAPPEDEDENHEINAKLTAFVADAEAEAAARERVKETQRSAPLAMPVRDSCVGQLA
jgi:hypothetical protein